MAAIGVLESLDRRESADGDRPQFGARTRHRIPAAADRPTPLWMVRRVEPEKSAAMATPQIVRHETDHGAAPAAAHSLAR